MNKALLISIILFVCMAFQNVAYSREIHESMQDSPFGEGPLDATDKLIGLSNVEVTIITTATVNNCKNIQQGNSIICRSHCKMIHVSIHKA